MRIGSMAFLGGALALTCVAGGCAPEASCEGVVCDRPPAAHCADGEQLRLYDATGVCEGGGCRYTYRDVACPDGCVSDECLGCAPQWQDVTACGCVPTECGECQGTLRQADGCGNERDQACTVPATGCDGACCDGACCAVGGECVGGQCCTPDCAGVECGPDGCGGDCGPCGLSESCDGGACVACGTGCGAGEACVGFACGPVAFLLASPVGSSPSLWCPAGYQAAGHWQTGPGAYDGAVEATDLHGYKIDAGWVWLCSADPAQVRVTVSGDDCGTAASACPDVVRGTWHVGAGCGGGTHGVGAAGQAVEAGWLALCVAAGVSVRMETGSNDCGVDGPGCGAHRRVGSWHTDPTTCGTGDTAVGDGGAAIEAGWLQLCVDSAAYPPADPTTVTGKVMTGYQGWFGAPGDGSQANGWRHWFRSQTPAAANATFDLWPDLSELDPDELFPTGMTLPGGATASLFSSYSAKTVRRHLRWMADYGIDGAFLQRFLVETAPGSVGQEFRDTITGHVMAGAESYGRTFAIMYDISGASGATLVADLVADWEHLVDDLGVLASPRYQHHDGLPLVSIWGLGFTDRPGTPADAQALLDYFCCSAQPQYRATVMGGVPTHWRTGTGDSQAGFDAIYRAFAIISPWSVGRYGDDAGVDSFNANQIQPDLVEAAAHGRDYLPVVWPGFSWANLMQDPGLYNAIPRQGGAFFWKQITAALNSGCTMLYVAMFDEVDESTAIFKAAPSQASVPSQGLFLSLDADGPAVPSDWYLRLAGAGAKTTAGQVPPEAALPPP